MKFICSKQNLISCINDVQKAVSQKTTIQVLEGILIEASEDIVKMTGNDLEIGIESVIPADVPEPGILVLNSKLFGEIVRKLPDADVTLEDDGGTISITCEHAYFKLNRISPDGFPELKEVSDADTMKVLAPALRENMKRVLFAVSQEENRPVLTGVLFDISGNKITLVAIDGFRMALREMDATGEDIRKKIVVPGRTVSELVKILDDSDEEAEVSFTNNFIAVITKTKKIVSRLLEGDFPNYMSIIPKDEETRLTASRSTMIEALERASIVTPDGKKQPVVMNIENDIITITLVSEKAELKEEVSVNMDGKSLKIGFNPRFLIEALRAADSSDEVEMTFRGSVGPCIIKPVSKEDNELYLVVPVKIRGM